MSWRLLFLSILIFAGIATALGLRAGSWLINHVPDQANVPNATVLDAIPQVDAKGNPIALEPQQPKVDGTQGFMNRDNLVDWHVKSSSLNETLQNEQQAAIIQNSNPVITSAVTTGTTNAQIETTPIQRNNRATPTDNRTSSLPNQAWEGEFHSMMSQCRKLGFNERPTCIQRTRNQYCAPNNAWGRVSDCPAR